MKIISGGQTGVDQGALRAAHDLGLETGGWMPRNFLTESGPRPDLAELYGLQQHASSEYPPRTKCNARDSDGTFWFGEGDGRGFICTRKAARYFNKSFLCEPQIESSSLLYWIIKNNIKVMNVAGSRESKVPGSEKAVYDFLMRTLDYLR